MAVKAYHWTCVTDPADFAPRDGAGLLSFGGWLWLIGGWNPDDKAHFPRICSNDVWRSRDGVAWACVKPNTFGTADFDLQTDWAGRHTAGYAVHRDRLWLVGGDANQHVYQNDVWQSTDGIAWERVTDAVPWGPRVLHYTVAFADRLWVIGGQTLPTFAPAEERFYADVWCSADGVHWECVQPSPPWPQRGMIGGAAVTGGRIWLLGGGTYDTPGQPQRRFYNDVWSSADGADWTCHAATTLWAPRQYHEVATWDGRLWVLEGYSGANRNDVWHSADGVVWEELAPTPWAPRHAASVVVHDDALWVIAGNNMASDVWRLDLA